MRAFVDGQNLFYAARNHFGHTHPNYDVLKLATKLVHMEAGRTLVKVRFYTGLHAQAEDAFWHGFWSRRSRSRTSSRAHSASRTAVE